MSTPHEEQQYLDLIDFILQNGEMVKGRNGYTKVSIGHLMKYSLADNTLPFLTTKKLAWKTCLKELLWFISGDTDNRTLQDQKVRIWNDNASRDFLDSRGLTDREENDLGPVYGFQWRHFNAPYTTCHASYKNKGIDQLNNIIKDLKNPDTKYSRRHILTAWNPNQLDEMALPPCHMMCQFNVVGDKLSCCLYQRSGDVGLGVPFNIASYALLTHMVAQVTGLKAHQFVHFIANAHIYDDHFDALREQFSRPPLPFPKLKWNREVSDIDDFKLEDFAVENYQFHEPVKMAMRK